MAGLVQVVVRFDGILPAENAGASSLPSGLIPGQPLTALAPMQDVTDLAFMGVVAHYGAPDYFFTEFFRVHSQSRPEKHILRSIDENTTGRPVFAQLIGEDLGHLARTATELLRHHVAGIDLNLGCPAPKVYKKNVGGGLLRDPDHVGPNPGHASRRRARTIHGQDAHWFR